MTDNKIIAQFLGLTIITDGISFFDTNYKPLANYHENWNDLMPVVDKIESLEFVSVYTNKTSLGEFSIEINYDTHPYKYNQLKKTIFIKDKNISKIEAVYKACVEFIKWYNQQIK
jgi:hypothetical protein